MSSYLSLLPHSREVAVFRPPEAVGKVSQPPPGAYSYLFLCERSGGGCGWSEDSGSERRSVGREKMLEERRGGEQRGEGRKGEVITFLGAWDLEEQVVFDSLQASLLVLFRRLRQAH
eukprot:650582-Hanusia_phi.AAC.1